MWQTETDGEERYAFVCAKSLYMHNPYTHLNTDTMNNLRREEIP